MSAVLSRAIEAGQGSRPADLVIKNVRLLDGETQAFGGMKELFLADGRHVTATNDPDTFKIVRTGETLRRVR